MFLKLGANNSAQTQAIVRLVDFYNSHRQGEVKIRRVEGYMFGLDTPDSFFDGCVLVSCGVNDRVLVAPNGAELYITY